MEMFVRTLKNYEEMNELGITAIGDNELHLDEKLFAKLFHNKDYIIQDRNLEGTLWPYEIGITIGHMSFFCLVNKKQLVSLFDICERCGKPHKDHPTQTCFGEPYDDIVSACPKCGSEMTGINKGVCSNTRCDYIRMKEIEEK